VWECHTVKIQPKLFVIGYWMKSMSKERFRSFEELECWQPCREASNFISRLVKSYPKEEKYGLVDDMKRAARSTTRDDEKLIVNSYMLLAKSYEQK